MNPQIEKLLALQEIDLKIRAMKARLDTIPIQRKKINEEIENERKNFHTQKELLMSEELNMKKIEAKIKEKEEQIQKLQAQSSMIRKNDEYRALMSEIEGIRKIISDLETEELMLMDKLQENKAKLKSLENKLAAKEKHAAEELKELDEINLKISNETAKMQSERESAKQGIQPELLSLYERILSKGSGMPVAEIKDGICGNCHLKITPHTQNQARKAIIVQCDNCSHIIYIP